MATYQIAQGDTLSGIASKQGTDVNSLMAANPNITDANKIYAGQSLNLPTMPSTKTVSATDIGSVPSYTPPTAQYQSTTSPLNTANNATQTAALSASKAETPTFTAKDQNQTLLKNLIDKLSGQSSEIATIQNDAGLIDKKQKATELSNNLNQIDKDYRDEVNNVKQTFSGTRAGLQDELARITDRYQNTRANASLNYNIAVGDYNAAQEIVNQKVSSLKDNNANLLQAYQLQAQSIENDLTESEKMQMQANITRKENEAKTVEDAYSTILQNASANKAPSSIYSKIDQISSDYSSGKITSQQAQTQMYQAAGNYATDPKVLAANAAADIADTVVDPASASILSQTGLSVPAFNFLTQGTSALTRMTAAQRLQYMKEAEKFVNKNGIDISTFQSRYKALNATVQANVMRNNQAQVAESELSGTLDNLSSVTNGKFSDIRWKNVAKLFAGQEFNDPNVAAYQFHLTQLRNELALYNAATAGQIDANGNVRQISDADYKVAENIIKNGFAAGSIDGFRTALANSVDKMGTVLNASITNQNKQVWDLFGVGKNYNKTGTSSSSTPVTSGTLDGGVTFKVVQ